MKKAVFRMLTWIGLGALGAWIGRLAAHSKVPTPEGRWREIPEDDL
jgi:hypothetical protein